MYNAFPGTGDACVTFKKREDQILKQGSEDATLGLCGSDNASGTTGCDACVGECSPSTATQLPAMAGYALLPGEGLPRQ